MGRPLNLLAYTIEPPPEQDVIKVRKKSLVFFSVERGFELGLESLISRISQMTSVPEEAQRRRP